MENKKGKGSVAVIILLILIVIGLGGYLGYHIFVEEENTKNKHNETVEKLNSTIEELKNANKSEKTYTYDDMEGVYFFEKELPEINDKAVYKLILTDDGTFKYSSYSLANSGYIGNYIIEGNKIKLNYIFQHGSDVSLRLTEGDKNLIISSKNLIIDNDPEKLDESITKVELKKEKEIKDEDKFDLNDNISDVIDAGGIYPKNN